MKKILIGLFLTLPLIAQTINIDSKKVAISIKNNSINVLTFPFVIQKADLSSETPENFNITSKNKTIVIIPTISHPDAQQDDLILWSSEGQAYLVNIKSNGTEQTFDFTSNEVSENSTEIKKYETGKIKTDIKNIIKKMVSKELVPGYKKIDVKKKFLTPDLEMQKEFIQDGGKYRAEEWYLKNISGENLLLDYENFYTNGVLAIAFEKKTLEPNEISKAWLIIDKNTIYSRMK